MTTAAGTNFQEFALKEDNELRFEVGADEDVLLELIKGSAEVFGTELDPLKKYAFPPRTRVAVFSWKGATIEISGKTESAYVAEHTPMVIYLNTHAALEQVRQHKEESMRGVANELPKGPRLMVVGPTDVGKSTVCRILCNYAVRQGRSPIYVDLDVGQNTVSVPGTIGALFINKTADVVEGFDRSRPLVYAFGYNSPSGNIILYETLCKELAEVITERCKTNPEASIGGMVINTCGFVQGEGYKSIIAAAEAFEPDVVVVIDHERLYNDLQNDLPNFVKIVHQPKSGGVETRDVATRRKTANLSIHRYFYGTRSNKYFPHTFEVSFGDVSLCKIGTEKVSDSLLPFAFSQDNVETKVISVQPKDELAHRLFAVSPCPTVSQAVLKANIVGFVVISEINMEQKKMTILCPQAQLAHRVLVWTNINYLDDELHRSV